jgi:hypothetical protein
MTAVGGAGTIPCCCQGRNYILMLTVHSCSLNETRLSYLSECMHVCACRCGVGGVGEFECAPLHTRCKLMYIQSYRMCRITLCTYNTARTSVHGAKSTLPNGLHQQQRVLHTPKVTRQTSNLPTRSRATARINIAHSCQIGSDAYTSRAIISGWRAMHIPIQEPHSDQLASQNAHIRCGHVTCRPGLACSALALPVGVQAAARAQARHARCVAVRRHV